MIEIKLYEFVNGVLVELDTQYLLVQLRPLDIEEEFYYSSS